MKIISIRQPWAWLIIAGLKDIENRDWPTKFRGPVAIHAGKYVPRPEEIAEIEFEQRVKIRRYELQYGGIVGTVEITDCVSEHSSPWFFGDFGFVLRNARPVRFHPLGGKLGFFESPGYVPEHLDKRSAVNVSVVGESELL